LSGVDFDEFAARPRTFHVIAERDEDERPVLTISDELQRRPRGAGSCPTLAAAAPSWGDARGSGDADAIAGLLHELAGLARRARRCDERLYRWVRI